MINYNIQFFGGRGAGTSAAIGGAEITINGRTTTYYFSKSSEGKYMMSNSLGEIPTEIPGGLTPRELINRALSNGAEVDIISKSEKEKRKKKRKKDQKQTDKSLNQAYVSDKIFVKGSRASRVGNRIRKRK